MQMIKKRKSFIIHFDSLDVIDELDNNQIAELFKAIKDYNLGEEIKLTGLMKAVFIPFKNQFDRDIEAYNEKCLTNAENGKKGGRPKLTQKKRTVINKTQVKPSEAKKPYSDSKNDSDSKNNNNNLTTISKDIEITAIIKKEPLPDINNLIKELREQCNKLGLAYEKKNERNFGKHILTAKGFGDFCKNINQTPVEFAKNIMKASDSIGFRKGACTGPMSIYQNYSEVYNKFKAKDIKKVPGITTI